MVVRLPVALLLALLLALPFASAQGVPPGTPLDAVRQPLRLIPGADIVDVRPDSGSSVTNLSVQVHCTSLSPTEPTTVPLSVTGSPTYFSVTLTPESVVFPANQPAPPAPPCANEFRAQEVLVFVSATGDAPADVPSGITVSASLGDVRASASFNASAAAYTAVDLTAGATSGTAEPGKPWRFDVTVRNRANAKAQVDLAGGAPRGLKVTVQGGEVGSKQAGDASDTATFPVEIAPEASLANGRYPVWINATSTVAGTPSIRADRDSVQLTVVVSGGGAGSGEEDNALPAAALAVPFALALAAAARRRKR